MDPDRLLGFRVERARSAFVSGDLVAAQEWLSGVDPSLRPRDLVASLEYELAKAAMAQRRWSEAERHLATTSDPFSQRRLGLLRSRELLMSDHAWSALIRTVEPAARLNERSLAPEVTGVWAAGAYYSRGAGSGAPWTQLLRAAKEGKGVAEADPEVTLSMATGYFCRWIAERTPLLRYVDVIVPIPANPVRYGQRMMSLPDELAHAAEQQLALPMVFDALRYIASDDLELRGLSKEERVRAIEGSMTVGKLPPIVTRKILVVDDLITHGTTLTEAARLLRSAGAVDVFAACLAHTEG
jgi:hypothetical protein